MSKRFTKLIAAFAATMTMLPASAQVMPENQVPLTPSRILRLSRKEVGKFS